MHANTVSIVDCRGASIAADNVRLAMRGSGGDQGIVCGAAADAAISQAENKASVGRFTHSQHGVREPLGKELENHFTGDPMRRRQARENGICLERAMLDQSQTAIERASCRVVIRVPRGKGGDDHARVGGSQRRMRSSVSRTCYAVSSGNGSSDTATTPLPRLVKRTEVGAISISSRPSAARISSAWPGFNPSDSRRAFGTMIRPAISMVVRMV